MPRCFTIESTACASASGAYFNTSAIQSVMGCSSTLEYAGLRHRGELLHHFREERRDLFRNDFGVESARQRECVDLFAAEALENLRGRNRQCRPLAGQGRDDVTESLVLELFEEPRDPTRSAVHELDHFGI